MAEPLYKTLEKAGQLIVAEMRATLKKKGINATGTLSDSISWTIKDTNDGLKLLIGMEQYGQAVDGGRGRSKSGGSKQTWRPKIIQWMKAKRIQPKAGVSMETAAFLITRSINRKGYKPEPFIDASLKKVMNEIYTNLEDGMVEVVEKSLLKRK